MPAEVLVGARVLVNRVWKAPGSPEPEPPQAEPVPETSPVESTWRQLLAVPVMELMVKESVIVTAPLNLEAPRTPKVVVGEAVPMPTRFSLALTTRVLASMLMPVFKVVVAVELSGIWKMAVPESVMTLKILPVKLEALSTSLMKSPEVSEVEEAVRKLPVVRVEEAVIEPLLAILNLEV